MCWLSGGKARCQCVPRPVPPEGREMTLCHGHFFNTEAVNEPSVVVTLMR